MSILLLLILIKILNFHVEIVTGFGSKFLCARIPGLTLKQREICEKAPDTVAAIGEGTQLGLDECQAQFQHSRWNCTTINAPVGHIVVVGSREAAFLYAISSAGVTYTIAKACALGKISTCGCAPPKTFSMKKPATKSVNPLLLPNITSYTSSSQTEAEKLATISSWRWGGCSADIRFATKLARIFLDSREVELDARSYMNLHNNKAGRKAIENTLETQCKCHGLSGSCTLKTCWVKLAPFRTVGNFLREKYKEARQVIAVQSKPDEIPTTDLPEVKNGQQHKLKAKAKKKLQRTAVELYIRNSHGQKLKNPKSSSKIYNFRKRRKKRKRRNLFPKHSALVYLEDSVNYCEKDPMKGVLGTIGRQCIRSISNTGSDFSVLEQQSRISVSVNSAAAVSKIITVNDDDIPFNYHEASCEILCCGRGYSTHQYLKRWKCRCKFTWCCSVTCDDCEQLVEVYICN